MYFVQLHSTATPNPTKLKFTIHEVRHSCWLPPFCILAFISNVKMIMQCNFISLFLFFLLLLHIPLVPFSGYLVSSFWSRICTAHDVIADSIYSNWIEHFIRFLSSSSFSPFFLTTTLAMQVNHLRIVIILNLYLFIPIFSVLIVIAFVTRCSMLHTIICGPLLSAAFHFCRPKLPTFQHLCCSPCYMSRSRQHTLEKR